MLLGREHELAAALEVCRSAAAGRGSVLIISGWPGIGKTALLGAVADAASDWDVVRATAVEVERTVAFTTLQALLWPLRDSLDELEASQAGLLRGILQLGPTVMTSAFTVGAATLALLSVASEQRPLVALVDDVQWADVASQEVLCFVGRRLERERVAVLAGLREGEASLLAEEGSFAWLGLGGLRPAEARSLLERSSLGELAPTVLKRLLDACSGNPLGLIELPPLLTQAQRCGEEPLPTPLEAGPLVQRSFAARASKLDRSARRALLLLAANGEADPGLLLRVGVPPEAIDSVEASGLVSRRGGTLVFSHPLVQSAIYGAADPGERRESHRTLAEAADGARHAWHLAEAASGPSESVAEALEAAAADARLTGGRAAEAQAFERAAALTPDDDARARRLRCAAQAWLRAGRVDHAQTLLERALPLARSLRTRAEIQLERGSMLVRQHQMDAAYDLLLAEADRVATIEPKLAARMFVQAETAIELERLDTQAALALAGRARRLAGQDGDRAELETINSLVVARMTTGAPPDSEDLALVARAAELLERAELRVGSEEAHWISYCLALHEHDDEARHLSDRCLAEARASGDVWNLCYALTARAALEQATGRIDLAHAWANEALPLADQIGEPYRICESYAVMAEVESARGSIDDCRRAHEVSIAHQWAGAPLPAEKGLAFGIASLACGRLEDAVGHLETAVGYLGNVALSRAWYQLIPIELAEAYAGIGRTSSAGEVLRRAAAGIENAPLVRPRAKLARVHALLAPEARIDQAFSVARALLEQVPQHLERTRVDLSWGERLRRAGRSADAVMHLEHALAGFEALGAVGWADRARSELEAATGTARPAQPRRTDVLTAQELRVCRHAAGGMRDREIAALLYLSPRTVESYLHTAYRKLDISNRTQLAGVLASDGIGTLSPGIDYVA
jgi:DNA-binding CsgD family transcriptional regulator